jgi:hypothetical protein
MKNDTMGNFSREDDWDWQQQSVSAQMSPERLFASKDAYTFRKMKVLYIAQSFDLFTQSMFVLP